MGLAHLFLLMHTAHTLKNILSRDKRQIFGDRWQMGGQLSTDGEATLHVLLTVRSRKA